MSTVGETGWTAKLKVGGEEVGRAKDVTLNLSSDEIEVTTKTSAGWKEFLAGLHEWSIDAELLWVPSETMYDTLQAAFLNRTSIACVFEDGDGYGYTGNGVLTQFGAGNPLADAMGITVSIRGSGALTPQDGS